jgi:hypothetical protein
MGYLLKMTFIKQQLGQNPITRPKPETSKAKKSYIADENCKQWLPAI